VFVVLRRERAWVGCLQDVINIRSFQIKLEAIGAEYIYTLESGWLPPPYGAGGGFVYPGLATVLRERDNVYSMSWGSWGGPVPYRVRLASGHIVLKQRAILPVASRRTVSTGVSSYRTNHFYTKGYSILVHRFMMGESLVELLRHVT
jgi:hypothetical protein